MKRFFIIAAIAGMALVGCTKNELAQSVAEQQEITFADPVAHTVTKVDLVPATYPTGTGFSVFAYYHKDLYATAKANTSNFTAYMRETEGVAVTHSTTSFSFNSETYDAYWAPSTAYYWPKDGYLTFSAYSPTTAMDHAEIDYNITNGITITDYVVKTDLSNQYDLMLSNRIIDQQSTSMGVNVGTTTYDGVQVAFNHVLSAVKFTVNTDITYTGYTITLNSLTVKNAYTTGTLTQFADINAVAVGDVWGTTQKTIGNYSVTSTDAVLSTTTTTFSDETDADLVLLPQQLTHSGSEKVVATIVYTVKSSDSGATPIQYTKDLVLDNTVGGTGVWDAGSRYIYNITIGMDKIVFAPIVTGWADGGTSSL